MLRGIVLIVICSSTLPAVQGELNRVFVHCCSLGRNFGRINSQCEEYPTPVAGIPTQDQYWCTVALGVCCREEVTAGKCDDGKYAAQESQDCQMDNGTPGAEEFKQCCDCCQLGLLAGSSGYGKQCDDAGFQIPKCNRLYTECCELSKARRGHYFNRTEGENDDSANQVSREDYVTTPEPQKEPYTTPCPDVDPSNPDAPPCVKMEPELGTIEPAVEHRSTHECPVGLEFHEGIGQCLDINECNRRIHNCQPGQKCTNTVGSYKCQSPLEDSAVRSEATSQQRRDDSSCPRGYQYDDRSSRCQDVDECATGRDNCGQGMRCENEPGTYRCIREISCGTGYTFDAHREACVDNDECQLGTHNCGHLYECINSQGSFRCTPKTCPKKMRLNHESGQCEHVQCNTGMEASDEGFCVDVNECNDQSTCKRNQQCFNTVGSFMCRDMLNCGPGYVLNDDGSRCEDVDECSQGTHSCVGGQVCENRPGTFSCNCQEGFDFNVLTKYCEDIDECMRYGESACPSSAECQNFPGSFRCNCRDGFRQGREGQHCQDIDECEEYNPCQHGCINSWGGYNCTCKAGYRLAPDGRSCEDVDECAERGPNALCFGRCINVPGSYNCTCPSGYRMLSDGRTCQDIDECGEQSVCNREDQICTNTDGGYQCHTIRCPAGYIQDSAQKNRCRRMTLACPVGDLACLQQPVSYSYNFMGIQSGSTAPPGGRIDLFTMRGPQQLSTQVDFVLNVKDARAMLAGVKPADIRMFQVRKSGFNQATIGLVSPIDGPQEVQLEMVMSMFTSGVYSGKAIANIAISVTKARPEQR